MNCFIAEQYIQVSVLSQNKSTGKAAVKLENTYKLSAIWVNPVEKRRQRCVQINVFFHPAKFPKSIGKKKKGGKKPVFLLLQFIIKYYVSLFSEFIRLKDCLNFSPSSDSGTISLA